MAAVKPRSSMIQGMEAGCVSSGGRGRLAGVRLRLCFQPFQRVPAGLRQRLVLEGL